MGSLAALHTSSPAFKGATQKWVPKSKKREENPNRKQRTAKLRDRALEEWLHHSNYTMQHGQDAEIRVEPVSSVEEQWFTYVLALTWEIPIVQLLCRIGQLSKALQVKTNSFFSAFLEWQKTAHLRTEDEFLVGKKIMRQSLAPVCRFGQSNLYDRIAMISFITDRNIPQSTLLAHKTWNQNHSFITACKDPQTLSFSHQGGNFPI